MLRLLSDNIHIEWSIVCPTCSTKIKGVAKRDEWLYCDPQCPKCDKMVRGITNSYHPKIK